MSDNANESQEVATARGVSKRPAHCAARRVLAQIHHHEHYTLRLDGHIHRRDLGLPPIIRHRLLVVPAYYLILFCIKKKISFEKSLLSHSRQHSLQNSKTALKKPNILSLLASFTFLFSYSPRDLHSDKISNNICGPTTIRCSFSGETSSRFFNRRRATICSSPNRRKVYSSSSSPLQHEEFMCAYGCLFAISKAGTHPQGNSCGGRRRRTFRHRTFFLYHFFGMVLSMRLCNCALMFH